MKSALYLLTFFLINPAFAQLTSFYDDFEDNKTDTIWNGKAHKMWASGDTSTYKLSEQNGVLEIVYNRKPENPHYSAFVFWPPEDIDVSAFPEISVQISSDIDFTLAIKPYYRNDDDSDNFYNLGTVVGNGNWTTHSINLKESDYSGNGLYQVVFFFDPGTNPEKSGSVYFDNFYIAKETNSNSNPDTIPADTTYLDPFELIDSMGTGINMGNVLELKPEWRYQGGTPREEWFDAYKSAGLKTVRIPVGWGRYTQTEPPYKVNSAWLREVEKFVDWGLERDLFIVINSHHDDWVIGDGTNGWESEKTRFDSIWCQVSRHFADKSAKLIFEIYNEPNNVEFGGMNLSQLNDMHQTILNSIRKTNPKRYVIYQGLYWSKWYTLKEATIPKDSLNDPSHIIGSFHYYEPWQFTHMPDRTTWGSASERLEIMNNFDNISKWSVEKGIPLFVGEYGAWNSTVAAGGYNDRNSVIYYNEFIAQAARSRGMASAYWDDGGYFNLKMRTTGEWDHEKLNRILGNPVSSVLLNEKTNTIEEFYVYPNPFDSYANIRIRMSEFAQIKIKIYNSMGSIIKTLDNILLDPGFHDIEWNTNDLSQGIYFISLTNGSRERVTKSVIKQ
jgi:aryl-phospho-beta-D-glucosidase BglC (GH1 family)